MQFQTIIYTVAAGSSDGGRSVGGADAAIAKTKLSLKEKLDKKVSRLDADLAR